MANNSLSLVIDADIARSAGTTEHPVSSSSRNVLDKSLEHGHHILMCSLLLAEWKKHNSLYARKWLASMFARRRVTMTNEKDAIRSCIADANQDEKPTNICLKDAHLIDLAIEKDRLVISNDGTARENFLLFVPFCGELKTIVWLNAVTDREFLEGYLETQCLVPEGYFLKAEAG